MIARTLALGAIALFAANAANATVYFDNLGNPTISGDGSNDGALQLGDSFTDATPGAVSISLLLSASNPASGGSVLVFLSPDDGSGGANGVAGATAIPPGGVPVDTILDSALTTTPSLITFSTNLTFATANQEYWVVLEPSGGSTFEWWYDDGTPATGTANQETVSDWTPPVGGPDYFADTAGTYKMEVFTPEPTTFAILGASLVGLGVLRRRKAKQA
jgi:hypothetical protein